MQQTPATGSEAGTGRIRELEKEVMDLKITNRAKDYLVDQLQKERTGFFDQLLSASHKVGELENKLLQIESPTGSHIEGGTK
jgi:predicted  nucleic acid-binding Zn-ribbon protein